MCPFIGIQYYICGILFAYFRYVLNKYCRVIHSRIRHKSFVTVDFPVIRNERKCFFHLAYYIIICIMFLIHLVALYPLTWSD